MKKRIICLFTISAIVAMLTTGCTSANTEQQLKDYQAENERLKQENVELNKENDELNQFKDRFSFSLTKVENTLYNLKNEGFLPFLGSQVNAPELIGAIKEIKNIKVETKEDELILSIMPQDWTKDFNTVLIVYDVYKPVLNMSEEDAGGVLTMAGIFKRTNGKWELVKFTRAFKGDASFSIQGM